MMSQSEMLYINVSNAIKNQASTVVLTEDYSESKICQTIRNVMRDNPQYFWYSYQYHYTPANRTLTFHYPFSKEKVDFFKEQIEAVITKDFRLDYVRSLSELEKVLYIFKWLVQYTNYNVESAYNQTIVSVFVKRNSVCTGYAKATQYLCHLLGIESKLVFGRFNNEIKESRHCWNLVKVDGVWYHLDVCMGDQNVAKKILNNTNIQLIQNNSIAFDNFCVSTDKILETRRIDDIDHLPTCVNSISTFPDIILLPTLRHSKYGCQISTVGMTSEVHLLIDDKSKVVKTVKHKDWKKLVDNECKCYKILSECPYILKYYGHIGNKIILEQATPLTELLQSPYYKLTIKGVLRLLIDIATAIKYCFDKGYAYRDIHIGNIYLRYDGTWALGDFGHCVPITADNIYTDAVGHPRFLPNETMSTGFFDRTSATYSLVEILKFLIDNYKLNSSTDNEMSFLMLNENRPSDSLEALIGFLSNAYAESASYEPIDMPDDKDEHDNIIIGEDIESFAQTSSPIVAGPYKGKCPEDFVASHATDNDGASVDAKSSSNSKYANDESIDSKRDNIKNIERFNHIPAEKNIPEPKRIDKEACGAVSTGIMGWLLDKVFDFIGSGVVGCVSPGTIDNATSSDTGNEADNNDRVENIRVAQSNTESNDKTKSIYVNSCVYAPAEVARDDFMLIQVYLYRDEESDKVRAKATMIDRSAEVRQYKPLELPIEIGDEVRIHLKMIKAEIEGDTKSFRWTGLFKGCEFAVYVPKDYKPSTLLGEVDVFINNMPAGEMIFKTDVVDTVKSNLLAKINARAFERIFVSYSHKDTLIVRQIVEGLRIANKDYFFDRHSLKGGDKYRDIIRDWIDTSDVFVLCWSKNASESIEVVKEKDHALEVISREGSRLRIYPLSITPEANLPDDMIKIYNFAQLNP